MDAMRKQKLMDAGIDVDSALERFMNNEGLLEKFLAKFPADPNHDALTAAIAAGDKEKALAASHTMKGMCGNFSMKMCIRDSLHPGPSLQHRHQRRRHRSSGC